jgi:hypothetical protein
MPDIYGGFQTNRLMELRNKQRQRQEEQFRLTQEPHFGPARSGFMNEHDYIGALNEDSELANLESLNEGKGPARSSAFYPVQGLRQARPGVGTMSLAGGGDMVDDFRAQQHTPTDEANVAGDVGQVFKRGRTMQELGDMDAITRSLRPTGQRALDLGYTADAAGKVGDIQRREGMNNARAAAREFQDPEVAGARAQQNAEDERLLESRYGRQADAEAKVRSAEIAAQGRVGAANATAQGGISREQVKALLKSRELQGLIGGQTLDPAHMQDVEDYLWQGLQPQGAQVGGGVDNASFEALVAGAAVNSQGADKLAQYWDQLTPAQQAQVRQRLGRR